MKFYFHYIDTPVSVAGLETKYVMNTTQSFRFLTQHEALANSFYKPLGLPKIVVNFYLYPNLVGPVTIDGIWQVLIWINGSAYHPTTFSLQFKEITVGGVELWNSGQINPTVTSTIGDYIDVPLNSYNLSTPLTHTFSADTTLLVSVEVNPSSAADARIWYDSPLYPSHAILPCQDYARPASVKTYAYDDSETNLFYYNWTQNQRVVTVRTNVTDPFGGYDVNSVNITILDPSNNAVVDNEEMTRISNGQWETSFSQMFEANWSYPETAERGNYTVKVTVIDNNGHYRNEDVGSFEPFVEEYTHTFTIGVIVYYDPAIRIVDDVDAPLPNAQVYVTWPNGSRDTLPRYTSANGFLNLTHVLPATYGFTVLWKDVVVNQTSMYLESDGPYTIHAEVYQLTVDVLDNTGAAVHGAYVIVYTQTGVGYGLAVSNEAGQSVFKLPKGIYNIETHYSAEYWLNVITTSAAETGINVNSSTSKTITITDFPPPVWITTGFLLLLALLAVSASV
ncbi:MAG: hypothetical protein JSV20_03070, partial [Candidatus Bathyarchaeota archaeon]